MSDAFDPYKNAKNIDKHGVGFDRVADIDWATAITSPDTRVAYGEERSLTYAMLDGRLYCLVWTVRGTALRPISLRRANTRERKKYEKEIQKK